MILVEKALHAGNLAAAFGVIATTAADLTLAGGASTLFGAGLSGLALLQGRDKKNAHAIAKDLGDAIADTHLTKNQDKWLRQLLAAFPPAEADFPAADMNGGKLAELLIKRIAKNAKDPELKSEAALDAFRRVLPLVLQAAISRNIETTQTMATMTAHLVVQANASAKADAVRNAGITQEAVLGLAQRIAEDTDDLGQAWLELQNAMDIAVRVQAEAQVSRLLARGAEVALLDVDTSKAATLMIRQADADAGGTAAFETLRGLQDSHYEIGRDKALNLVSRLAIDLAQLIVARATDADERGAALNDLGLAL